MQKFLPDETFSRFRAFIYGMGLQKSLCFVVLASVLAAGQQAQPSPSIVPQPDDTKSSTDSKTLRPILIPDANGNLSQEQMQQLLRIVAEKDEENDKRLRDYTYIERDVQHDDNGKGEIKKTEIKTFEILQIYGEQVQRLIQKDDQPLDSKDAAKEEEKIQKIIDKRKSESDEERKKREEKAEKEREDNRKFVREVADAYIFTMVGSEDMGGRDTWVIAGEPRPGYEPHMKEAKFLPKFHGRVWIDKDDLQLAKMEVEAIDTVSIGLVLARIHKGTRVMLEQTRVNDEVWLPKHMTFKVDARVALLKGVNVDGEQNFSDYKKFSASSKIIGVSEAAEQKTEQK
jgi:hypothetical protein